MPGTWNPGNVAPPGSRVINNPLVVNGAIVAQKGIASFPPTITAPASPGTGAVGTTTTSNTTGYDCIAYLAPTAGTITSVKIGSTTVPGTIAAGALASYYVPANSSLTVVLSAGTLTWAWLAI